MIGTHGLDWRVAQHAAAAGFLLLGFLLLMCVGPAVHAQSPEPSDATKSVAAVGELDTTAPELEPGGDRGSKESIALPWIAYLIPLFGVVGLAFTVRMSRWVTKQDPGNERMVRIASNIADGAMSFLRSEYTILAVFVFVVAGMLAWAGGTQGAQSSPMIAVSFVFGAICSALAGFIGMRVATKANVRTTNAAQESLGKALEIAFAGGSVMGLGVVGLGVFGLGLLFVVYCHQFGLDSESSITRIITVLTGFSFGASSIALFARVGGGIYTKAADVGADLVGKVEAGIPEDHPLNPATIADNVGDNVGDVAGMGADLFESYVGSIIGSMVWALRSSVFFRRMNWMPFRDSQQSCCRLYLRARAS